MSAEENAATIHGAAVAYYLAKTEPADYSIDALAAAGVDMRDPAPVQAAFDILAGYVERLDELTRA